MDITSILPAECITHIISLTSPRDACRSSAVSPAFKSAADSGTVWEKFLPPDYKNIVSNSVSASSLLAVSLSKKDVYFHLCHSPVLINNSPMSFAIEKESGKKCYMVGARALSIAWRDSPIHWTWKHLPKSRFSEVAKLQTVPRLYIKGWIETKLLSPKTMYAAYLVYKSARYRFSRTSVRLSVNFEGTEPSRNNNVVLDPGAKWRRPSRYRGNGWREIEIGEFFNKNGDDGWVVCSLFDLQQFSTRSGLIIEGMEFRPKIIVG